MLDHRRVRVSVALCTVVAAVIAVVGGHRLTMAGVEERLDERRAATVAAAAAFATVLDVARGELEALRTALPPWTGSTADEAAARALLSARPPLGVLDGVVVAGADGIVRAADGSTTAEVGARVGTDLLVALGGTDVLTGPTVGSDGHGALRLALPLTDAAGRPSGVVIGRLSGDGALRRTTATLAATHPAPRLVWSDGTVLGADGTFDRDLSLRTPAQLAADGPGLQRLPSAAGPRLVTAYAPLPGGWAVVSSEPAAAFDATARGPLLLTLAMLLVVLAGAGTAAAWALARVAATRAETDDARRSLLAVAGHELRTPLTVVSGGLQTLERRWDELPDDRRREVLVFTRRHARRLEHQVERLLFAAQLERGAAAGASPRTVDAGELARVAVDEHATRAPAHRLVVHAPDLAPVSVDVRALEQVLFHLLENAVRYSPAGGDVTVTVARDDTTVTLTVEDEGVGLPSDTSRLFERFGQVEAVDTRVLGEGGLGLGLHIVRTLVERQGGTVTAANRPHGGAAFRVLLPLAPVTGRADVDDRTGPRPATEVAG